MHHVNDSISGQIHQCANLPASVRIEKGSGYFGEAESWVLVIARLATEKDLEENHYLEEVDEEIWCTLVEISHCPYCGIHLDEIPGGEAEIAHFDYSRWSSRIT